MEAYSSGPRGYEEWGGSERTRPLLAFVWQPVPQEQLFFAQVIGFAAVLDPPLPVAVSVTV